MGQQGHLPPLCGHCARWGLQYESTLLSISFDYVCLFLKGFLRLCLYVSYMAFMLWILYVPLHILRRIYITTKYARHHTWAHQHVKIMLLQFFVTCLAFSLCSSVNHIPFLQCYFFLFLHRNFQKSVYDVISSHQAIRNLNTL